MPGGSLSSNEKVKATKQIDVMQCAIVDYVQKEEELQAEISRYWEKRAEVIQCIEKMKNVEYDLLHKVYVQGKTLDEVAYMNDKSYSWATTVHGRALQHVQEILDRRAGQNMDKWQALGVAIIFLASMVAMAFEKQE